MQCETFDFIIKQGTDFSAVLTISDDAGAAIDLTGYVFSGKARLTYPTLTEFNFVFNVLNQTTDKGKVAWFLLDTATSAIELAVNTDFVYDVESNNSGVIMPIVSGVVTISPNANIQNGEA